MIDILEIEEKRKINPVTVASLDDFAYREAGQADPSLLTSDPSITLYCLDHAARRAIFVQTPVEVDITAAPFLYQAQFEQAQRLFAVPYEVLHRVAAGIDLRNPLILIHSTGRAGSTLLSKAFQEMESTTSLSEPDVYTQAVAMRLAGGDDEENRGLLASATKILFNPAFTRGASLGVVKFRSFCIDIADLLSDAFPHAGNLFLYRDLEAFIRSTVRIFDLQNTPPEVIRRAAAELGTMTPLLAEELNRREDLDGVEVPALMWLSTMHTYARLHRQGMRMPAVRYEDLVADPFRALETVLTYLNLPVDAIPAALRAFERDSQIGSALAREVGAGHTVRLEPHHWEMVRDLVRRYPIEGAGVPAASFALP